MREILFRGKRVDNGESWVYGFYWNRGELAHYIKVIDDNGNLIGDYEVHPETVGEFTGSTDKNVNKIFEGDIVRLEPPESDFNELHNPREVRILKVVFFEGKFALDMHKWWKYGDGMCALGNYESERLEVIGNIHDNPELLEAKE